MLTVINHSHIPQNVAKTIEYTTTSSESWNLGFGVALGTTITLLKIETKIPLSGKGHKKLLKIRFVYEIDLRSKNLKKTILNQSGAILKIGRDVCPPMYKLVKVPYDLIHFFWFSGVFCLLTKFLVMTRFRKIWP